MRLTVSGRQRLILVVLLTANAVAVVAFTWVLVQHAAIPDGPLEAEVVVSWSLLVVVVAMELLRLVQTCGLCVFACLARDPVPMEPLHGARVAFLTTIVPTREPVNLVLKTLRAMRQVVHEGPMDLWILDEENDPDVRGAAAHLGIKHFSRHERPEYNTNAGEFRARTKAGNHNSWRAEHGAEYDIVAQVDPDHVPRPEFLARTLGYFRDPDVAFVVAPQVYGNTADSFVAHAAAAQGYVFTGIVQRGGNGVGVPLLIGTNHVYRMDAWAQVNGYQDSIIEDHLTSMVVHGTVNPRTGNRWVGVYTPDILAVGEGPSTWSDFFHQQERWCSGIWQILLRRRGPTRRRLSVRQRLAYAFLQSFYPVVGMCWFLGNLATVGYVTGMAQHPAPDRAGWTSMGMWCLVMISWVALFGRLRRWYLCPAERSESVLRPWLITVLAAPVYARAGLSTVLGRQLGYVVTGKGDLRTGDTPWTFRTHLAWALVLVLALLGGVALEGGGPVSYFWAVVGLAVCLGPPSAAMLRGAIRYPDGKLPARRSRESPLRSRPRRTGAGPRRPPPGPPGLPATAQSRRSRTGTARPR
ncbi:glycosyltransferase family 2 protein [Kocuria sabuli]|uniref:glycosyltransferase family 2 protein n=1 Tax=Kocuria sabuli TaxID=3071448 RepID=UPI0034D507EB